MPINNPNNFYQNQQYNQNFYQPPIQQEYFVGVGSLEAARNYPIAPGSTVWLIDANNQKVYVKARDYQGNLPNLKEFDLVEVLKPAESEMKIDEGELASLKTEIKKLSEELANIKPIIEELKS